MNDILTDEGSWDRASELYLILDTKRNVLYHKINNSFEGEDTRKLERKIEQIDKRLENVCSLLEVHTIQASTSYYDNLSIDELIEVTVTPEAIKKYDIHREMIKTEEGVKDFILVRTYKKGDYELYTCFEVESFSKSELPYTRAYLKSPERNVLGGKGSCQHLNVDIIVNKEEKGVEVLDKRKVDIKGNQAILHTLSTIIQQLTNWEDKVYDPIGVFDYHIHIQNYESINKKLNPSEKQTIKEAFQIIEEQLFNNLEIAISYETEGKGIRKSNNERIRTLFIKTFEIDNFKLSDKQINYLLKDERMRAYKHFALEKMIEKGHEFSESERLQLFKDKSMKTSKHHVLEKMIEKGYKFNENERLLLLKDESMGWHKSDVLEEMVEKGHKFNENERLQLFKDKSMC